MTRPGEWTGGEVSRAGVTGLSEASCSGTGAVIGENVHGADGAYCLMKMPLMFISSAWGFGEKRSASALLIFPALIRR